MTPQESAAIDGARPDRRSSLTSGVPITRTVSVNTKVAPMGPTVVSIPAPARPRLGGLSFALGAALGASLGAIAVLALFA